MSGSETSKLPGAPGTRNRTSPPFQFMLACVALCALLWLPGLPLWMQATMGLAVLAIGTLVLTSSPSLRPGLATPLFLLSVISLVFYVIVPAGLTPLFSGSVETNPQYLTYADHVMNGSAQALTIRVSALLCTTNLLLVCMLDTGTTNAPPKQLPIAGMAAIIVSALGLLTSKYAGLDAGLSRGILALLPVLLSFGCMATVIGVPYSSSAWRMAGLVLAVGLCSAVAAGLGKQPVAILLVLAALAATRLAIGWKRLLLAGIGAAMFGMTALTLLLPPHPTKGEGLSHALHELGVLVEFKVWVRQLQTSYCLQRVMDIHLHVEPGADLTYFKDALVPRFVWPDKPRVRDGADYARQYCGIPYAMPDHSTAVTLLGEPVIVAGKPGLAVALLVMLGCLAVVSAVLFRGGSISSAWAGAITPWLIDFDQHFALYLANAAKFGLLLAPVALAVWLLSDKPARTQSEVVAR